eukprot:2896362-Prymnesium_polylepis.1
MRAGAVPYLRERVREGRGRCQRRAEPHRVSLKHSGGGREGGEQPHEGGGITWKDLAGLSR